MKMNMNTDTLEKLKYYKDKALQTSSSRYFIMNLCSYIRIFFEDKQLFPLLKKKINVSRKQDNDVIAPLKKIAVIEARKNNNLIMQVIRDHDLRSKSLDEISLLAEELDSYDEINPKGTADSYLREVWSSYPKLHSKLKTFAELDYENKIHFKEDSAYKAYRQVADNISLASDIKIYSAWDALNKYRVIIEPPKYKPSNFFDPEEDYQENLRSDFKYLLDKDPKINLTDTEWVNLSKDKQKLAFFHDWLINEFSLISKNGRKPKSRIGKYALFTDGSMTYDGNEIELNYRPSAILGVLIEHKGSDVNYDVIITSTYSARDQKNARKYHNLHSQISTIRKYLKDEFGIQRPIVNTASSHSYRLVD